MSSSDPDAATKHADSEPTPADSANIPRARSDVPASDSPASDNTDNPSETERWRAFVETEPDGETTKPSVATTRSGKIRQTAKRLICHEWSIVAIASVILAAAMTWPVLADPMHTIPQDLGDPLLIAYIMSWGGYAIWNNPSGLWDTNSFFPDTNSFAFTDTFLGYLPVSILGSGPEAALLRYNILFVLTFALAFFGCYMLMRQLGARTAGSVVAAAAFAYAPWKLAQAGHLQVLSIGGICLALAMLARGHAWSLRHGYRPRFARPGWIVAGWIVATWQVSIGFGMGVPFGYLLAGIGIVALIVWLFKRPRVTRSMLAANAGGTIFFAGVSLAMALPYFQAIHDHPEAIRTLDYVDNFSPAWASFLISPEESRLWGELHAPAREGLLWPPETTLLVGFTLLALAITGLIWSAWTRRQRVFIGIGVLVSFALAMGTNFIDDGDWAYGLLFNYLPGFDGLRTPGRLVVYVTLLLCLLAAGTLTHLADRIDAYAKEDGIDDRWQMRAPMSLRLALLIPVLFILAEGIWVPDVREVPPAPVALEQLDEPILVLPSDGGNDTAVQFWSVDGFPKIVNGTAGFVPAKQEQIRYDALSFPSQTSVDALREAGILTVVVVRSRLDGTPWENVLDVPRVDSSVTVTDYGNVVVFTL